MHSIAYHDRDCRRPGRSSWLPTDVTDSGSRLPGTSRHSSMYAPLGARSYITVPSSFHVISPGSGYADTGWKFTPWPRVCHSAVAVAYAVGDHRPPVRTPYTHCCHRCGKSPASRRSCSRQSRADVQDAAIRRNPDVDHRRFRLQPHDHAVVVATVPSANSIHARRQQPNIMSGTVCVATSESWVRCRAIDGPGGSGSGRGPRRHVRR